MKSVYKKIPKKQISIILILLLVSIFWAVNSRSHKVIPPIDPVPEKMVHESLETIEPKLPHIISEFGINKTLAWVRAGFAAESINMFQCHTLTHLIGHRALDYYNGDIHEALQNQTLDECEGGYVHGVEAQVVENAPNNYRDKLFQICSLLLAGPAYGGCYHGAGHAFMTPDKTPQQALAACDSLLGGPSSSVESCYNGVFSEYTNLLGGRDGHTGLPLSGGPAFKLTGPAIQFCATFAEKYQIDCALEVSGFGFGPEATLSQIENSMHECTQTGYPEALQAACLKSMAAVSTQHGLPLRSIKPPELIYNITETLRHAYITGVAGETKQYIYNGQQKDWQSFCSSFRSASDQSYCNNFFKS